MDRKEFLKKSIGMLSIVPILVSCSEDSINPDDSDFQSETGSTNGTSSGNCAVTNSETEGPFPNKNASSLVMANIVGDRPGVKMTMEILIKNKNTSCLALSNVLVDVWHCDAQGNYSQYGGTQMQSTNYSNVNWLRGRQTTDSNGLVGFTSIFPGWYGGRAPHVHVHVYTSAGRSLLVTQIAFPKAICDNVYTNATDYKSKGLQDTTNERDNVFGDGFANELAAISGSITEGYKLTHTIVVNG